MDRVEKQESPIIRLTRWTVTGSLPKKGSNGSNKDGGTTIFGVDSEGKERVYAQVPSNRWKKFSNTDPSWEEAQKALFQRLLSNPGTRDTLIKINLKAALEKGDEDSAIKLFNALSESEKAKLMTQREPNPGIDETNKSSSLSDAQKIWAQKRKQGLNPSDLEKLIIKQRGRCALSGALMIFDKALGTPKTNGQGCHPLYASVDHVFPGRENRHQLVCYDLNDLKGHLPYKVFLELKETTSWKTLMQQWKSQSEKDPTDISAFKDLLQD